MAAPVPLPISTTLTAATEDRLHRAWPGVVGEPLHPDTETLFKPAFLVTGKVARHKRLNMRDVWKMPDADCRRCRRSYGSREEARHQRGRDRA